MQYLFKRGKHNSKKLLLLHGTGGNEHSLVDIAYLLEESPTILSIRGRVEEDGMNRFFKRNGLNQFDIESLEEETDHLLEEITLISEKEGVNVQDWIVVGYSNGANIAAHAMMERNTQIQNAILFHPMSLGVDTKNSSKIPKNIWLSVGTEDPIVSKSAWEQLVSQLKKHEARLFIETTKAGHQLTYDEINSAKKWLKGI